jgi:hypothetical protein
MWTLIEKDYEGKPYPREEPGENLVPGTYFSNSFHPPFWIKEDVKTESNP